MHRGKDGKRNFGWYRQVGGRQGQANEMIRDGLGEEVCTNEL